MKITDLNLPSKLHDDQGRMEHLREQVDILHQLGLAENGQLTPLGESMERWIGQADPVYAMQLQRCVSEGFGLSDTMFWLVATALSNTPAVTLRSPHSFFVDYDNEHPDMPHFTDAWSHPRIQHEDVSVFMMFSYAAAVFPRLLWRNEYPANPAGYEPDLFFQRWCNSVGVNPRKLLHAAKAVRDTWKLFSRINGDSPAFSELFGGPKQIRLSGLPWQQIRQNYPENEGWRRLFRMLGTIDVHLSFNSETGRIEWKDASHDHKGVLSQDDTPVRLNTTFNYTARLVPSRRTKGDDVAWRLAHLGRKP